MKGSVYKSCGGLPLLLKAAAVARKLGVYSYLRRCAASLAPGR